MTIDEQRHGFAALPIRAMQDEAQKFGIGHWRFLHQKFGDSNEIVTFDFRNNRPEVTCRNVHKVIGERVICKTRTQRHDDR